MSETLNKAIEFIIGGILGVASGNLLAWISDLQLQIGNSSRSIAAWIGGLLPYRPRIINRIYAKMNHFFWLPCDICGEYYGGHEWKDDHTVTCQRTGRGRGVCPKKTCKEEADAINKIINGKQIGRIITNE
jgi:hypothetical protein